MTKTEFLGLAAIVGVNPDLISKVAASQVPVHHYYSGHMWLGPELVGRIPRAAIAVANTGKLGPVTSGAYKTMIEAAMTKFIAGGA